MYYEFFSKGNLILRGRKLLNTIEFEHELNLAPSVNMTLDGDWIGLIDGREEVKIHLDSGKIFYGIVWGIEVDKVAETITLDVRHVVTEWQYRQISVNHAMSNKNLNIVFKGDKTKKNESTGETITASDFSILAKRIKGMTLAKWIDKASAQAWNTSNGDVVKVTSVDASDVKKDNGTYDVKFSTAKGTSVTVQCEVVDAVQYQTQRTHSNNAKTETIAATPFTVNIDVGLDAEKVKEKVKADAWRYRHKDQKIAVTSITTNFQNQVGKYHVTASTANGTSITVKVEVEDNLPDGSVEPSVVDKLEDIYTDMNFAYPGWQIDFQDDSASRMIDYVYSKQNKLEALTQTVELTDDLWWRVGFWGEKKLEIGKFGEKKPYILSLKPSGKSNIRIISEPKIKYDFENVVNVATVYADKSDGGMSSVTLRDVYMDKSVQKDGFPVVILRANVNNERDYKKYITQFPKLAPNNELEYAVLDEESIALESGTIIEGSYLFNDLSPFEDDGKVITDKKRKKAAVTAYHAAIKQLKQVRRSYDITLTVAQLPNDVLAGDRIRLVYDNKLLKLENCSSYFKKLLAYDDWFYITRIRCSVDDYGNETNELTLTKWLKIQRETAKR